MNKLFAFESVAKDLRLLAQLIENGDVELIDIATMQDDEEKLILGPILNHNDFTWTISLILKKK